MKYKKPYFDKSDGTRIDPPLPMLEIGLNLFLKIFEKEIKDLSSWKRQPSLSQLILDRSTWLFWHPEEAREIGKRAKPFIVLGEEAYRKNPQKTIQIFSDIAFSYSDIQQSAFSRDSKPSDTKDFVIRFNYLLDEYRFRYEELFNRLISFSHGNIQIIIGKPPVAGEDCINIDANQKLKGLNNSILPSSTSYDNISYSVRGIKAGVRNALSHGGRRILLSDEKKYLLQDSSGWRQKYSIDEFHKELDILDRTINALEFGTLVFHMNHIKELTDMRKDLPNEFTEEQKSQILYIVARDCEFEVIDAESNPPFLDIKLRFAPIQPRESEVYGRWGGSYFSEKIPPKPVRLKEKALSFISRVSILLDKETPGIRMEISALGNKLLSKISIKDVRGFNEASKEIKSYDDYPTKNRVEANFVKWDRISWATGEINDDGTIVKDY